MRNEPKSSKSSKSSNSKQNQQVMFLVLLLLVSILGFELVRGRLSAGKRKRDKEPATAMDTTKRAPEKKETAADSIAKVLTPSAFRQEQLKATRVKDAYKLKGDSMQAAYKRAGIDANSLNVYIRAFKEEKILEVWAKDKTKDSYTLLKTYKFCKSSGKLGPKRKAGDDQIPEGFYKIDRFNPQSRYLLSLGLNYPNKVDKKLCDTTDLNNDIFIHGGCTTIGSIPISDDKIRELYIITIDARSAGQKNIPVSIFPTHMTDANMRSLKVQYQDEPQTLKFWASLRKGYLAFESCKRLPSITLTDKGEYICKSDCGGN